MILKCKKTYYMTSPGKVWGIKRQLHERISAGEHYKVLTQYTKPDGERYWLFLIPSEINPEGSGHFNIDKYFVTPEEERINKIRKLLKTQI